MHYIRIFKDDMLLAWQAYNIAKLLEKYPYPESAFNAYLVGGDDVVGELQVRIPSAVPRELVNILEDLYCEVFPDIPSNGKTPEDLFRICPAIESIELPIAAQNKGFLTMLIYCLAKAESIRYVIISTVLSARLQQHLEKNNLWTKFGYDSLFGPIPSYYVSAEAFIESARDICEDRWRFFDMLRQTENNKMTDRDP